MSYELPALPYAYDALEPWIDATTMEIHYSRHHQAYLNNLKAALEGHDALAAKGIEAMLRDLDAVPEGIRAAVRNNGGGFYNHNLFWACMSPQGGGEPTGALGDAITATFGSFEAFKGAFAAAGAKQFGSGWAWLAATAGGELKVVSTPNQDTPLALGLEPLLGLDVWEHAYYLKYQNKRPDYIQAFFHVVHWPYVASRFAALTKG
jgi:Fe-Mn family superoxide dismutase